MQDSTNEFSFVVKPSQYGVGVFTAHGIKAGTRLRVFADDNPIRWLPREDVPEPFRDICLARGGELLCPPDFGYLPIGWYMNHSAVPNAIHDPQEPAGHYGLWNAARDIAEGEEITINYNALDEPDTQKKDFYRS